MKNYIFITTEGFTFSPNCNDSEPDIENCQVLGFSDGKNSSEAFQKFKKSNSVLNKIGFNTVLCYELGNSGISESFTL